VHSSWAICTNMSLHSTECAHSYKSTTHVKENVFIFSPWHNLRRMYAFLWAAPTQFINQAVKENVFIFLALNLYLRRMCAFFWADSLTIHIIKENAFIFLALTVFKKNVCTLLGICVYSCVHIQPSFNIIKGKCIHFPAPNIY